MNVRIKLSEFPRRNTSKWQRFPLWASVPWVPKVVRAKSRIVVCPEHSFYVKATVFNMSVPSENTWMCSKLVTKAFFLFALTEMMRTYQPGTTISSWAFSHNLDTCLLEFTPTLKPGVHILQIFRGAQFSLTKFPTCHFLSCAMQL